MKKIIFLISLFLFSVTAIASESPDTIVTHNNAREIIIIENSNGVKAVVMERDGSVYDYVSQGGDKVVTGSSSFNRIRCSSSGWSFVSGGLTFGFVATPGTPSSLSPDMGKSMEIGWLNLIGMERRLNAGWAMSLGMGIDWRNFRSTSGLLYQAEGGFTEAERIDPAGYRFSRIKVFSLQFPLLFSKTFGGHGMRPGLAFGPIFNFNTHASVKSSLFDEQGKRFTKSSSDIGRRAFTVDIYGQLSLGPVGIYARYSPLTILKNPGVLDYHPLSVGVVLFH